MEIKRVFEGAMLEFIATPDDRWGDYRGSSSRIAECHRPIKFLIGRALGLINDRLGS